MVLEHNQNCYNCMVMLSMKQCQRGNFIFSVGVDHTQNGHILQRSVHLEKKNKIIPKSLCTISSARKRLHYKDFIVNGDLTFHESVVELKKAWKSHLKETFILVVQPLQFGSESSFNVGRIVSTQGRSVKTIVPISTSLSKQAVAEIFTL